LELVKTITPLRKARLLRCLPLGHVARAVLASGLVMALEAAPLDEWHQRSAITQGGLNQIAFGQGRFVAGGGTLQTSSDGINWVWEQTIGGVPPFSGLLATKNLIVAVGAEGTILTSTDAEKWVLRSSGFGDSFLAVAYGNGLFLAVGPHTSSTGSSQSVLASSVDGTNWTISLVEMGGDPLDLAFGNGVFVAAVMGSNQQPACATSVDGQAWDLHAWPADVSPRRLAYGNGQFVAVGGLCGLGRCSGSIVTSVDGTNWTRQEFQPRFLYGVAFGHDQFIAVGGNCDMGGCDSLIIASRDGQSWVPHRAGTRTALTSVAFGDDTVVILGENGLILQSDPLMDTPPRIGRQSSDQTVPAGATLTLNVVAVGTSPLAYQWTQDDKALGGATNSTLVLTNVQPLNSGIYVVSVSNAFGSVLSRPAAVDVRLLGPLSHWHWRNPTPQGGPLNSVTCVAGTFVAGGSGGYVLTSRNAINWDLALDDSIPGFSDLSYGNGRFVGVTDVPAISVDGLHWARQDQSGVVPLSHVAFGAGLFVGLPAQYGSSNVLTSTDGVAWSLHDAGTTNMLLGITYSHGIFFAVGERGTVATSKDGLAWSAHETDPDSTLEGGAISDSLFVAVGVSGYERGTIVTSVDGLHWTPTQSTSGHLHSVACGNGVWVAAGGVCGRYGCTPVLVSSSDGTNWTGRRVDPIQSQTETVFTSVAFGQGTFVAVNQDGGILTSTDGVRWQARNNVVRGHNYFGTRAWVSAIVQGGDDLVAVGSYYFPYHNTTLIWSSTDGVNWTERTPAVEGNSTGLASITFGKGTFIAVGATGTNFTSSNAADWAAHPTPGGIAMDVVCFANARFIATDASWDTVGDRLSRIWTSEDGENWVERYAATNASLSGIASGNGLVVAAGQTNYQSVLQQALLLRTTDGLAWTPLEVPGTDLLDITFGNGLFVALAADCGPVGCTQHVLTSPDGVVWTAHSLENDVNLAHLAFGQGYFVASASDSVLNTILYFSTDGVHWFNGRVGATPNVDNVGFAGNTFWGMGANGTLLQSDPLFLTGPVIALAPLEQTVFAGNPASFQVVATGSSPFSYQWFKDGNAIPGATEANLAWQTADLQDQGSYFVAVSNPLGAAVTQPVLLKMQAPPEPPELELELDPWAELTLLGKTGRTYELQSTDSLQATNAWHTLTRLGLPSVPFTWTDARWPISGSRFYRAVPVP
jgi:hypothetical protein